MEVPHDWTTFHDHDLQAHLEAFLSEELPGHDPIISTYYNYELVDVDLAKMEKKTFKTTNILIKLVYLPPPTLISPAPPEEPTPESPYPRGNNMPFCLQTQWVFSHLHTMLQTTSPSSFVPTKASSQPTTPDAEPKPTTVNHHPSLVQPALSAERTKPQRPHTTTTTTCFKAHPPDRPKPTRSNHQEHHAESTITTCFKHEPPDPPKIDTRVASNTTTATSTSVDRSHQQEAKTPTTAIQSATTTPCLKHHPPDHPQTTTKTSSTITRTSPPPQDNTTTTYGKNHLPDPAAPTPLDLHHQKRTEETHPTTKSSVTRQDRPTPSSTTTTCFKHEPPDSDTRNIIQRNITTTNTLEFHHSDQPHLDRHQSTRLEHQQQQQPTTILDQRNKSNKTPVDCAIKDHRDRPVTTTTNTTFKDHPPDHLQPTRLHSTRRENPDRRDTSATIKLLPTASDRSGRHHKENQNPEKRPSETQTTKLYPKHEPPDVGAHNRSAHHHKKKLSKEKRPNNKPTSTTSCVKHEPPDDGVSIPHSLGEWEHKPTRIINTHIKVLHAVVKDTPKIDTSKPITPHEPHWKRPKITTTTKTFKHHPPDQIP